ncbi:DUF2147 domain-containing protein [Belliella pelovolcani]|uniref:DUF2147 domain-containing protein n=1 Tax=Belliella pelovolcani TaxID=529505 RepID=UPI003919384B
MKPSLTQLLTFSLLFFASYTTIAQDADAIVGEWYTTEKDAKVEIYKENGKYNGKITWLEQPTENGKPILDANNSDKSKRDRKILGMELLEGFEFKDGTWENGTIYDPTNGKTYSCTLKKKNDKTLEVRGYIGISLVGRTVEWTKVK